MKAKLVAMLGVMTIITVHTAAADAASSYTPPVEAHAPASEAVVQAKAERKAARKTMRAADRKLAASVRKSISAPGDVNVSRVSVLARSGAITLAGTVPETGQIELAAQHAQSVAGVASVKNNLTLDSAGR